MESVSAVAVKLVGGARSTFNQWFNDRYKIEAAKAEAKKRAKKKYDQEHYDEYKKLRARTAARVKAGIPIEAPLMKSYYHAKLAERALRLSLEEIGNRLPAVATVKGAQLPGNGRKETKRTQDENT